MARLNQKIKQNGGQRNAERCREDCHGLGSQWMFEGVSEQIEADDQEEHRKKTG
jgi:hypothetical protein